MVIKGDFMSKKNRIKQLRRILKDYEVDPSVPLIKGNTFTINNLLKWRDENKELVRFFTPQFEDVYIQIHESPDADTYGELVSILRFTDIKDMKQFKIRVYKPIFVNDINETRILEVMSFNLLHGPSLVSHVEYPSERYGITEDHLNTEDNAVQSALTVVASLMAMMEDIKYQREEAIREAIRSVEEDEERMKNIVKDLERSVEYRQVDELERPEKDISYLDGRSRRIQIRLENSKFTRKKMAWPREGHWRHYKDKNGRESKKIWIHSQICRAKGISKEVKPIANIYNLKID